MDLPFAFGDEVGLAVAVFEEADFFGQLDSFVEDCDQVLIDGVDFGPKVFQRFCWSARFHVPILAIFAEGFRPGGC